MLVRWPRPRGERCARGRSAATSVGPGAPGPAHAGPGWSAGLGGPRLGEAARAAPRARRVCRGGAAPRGPPLSGGRDGGGRRGRPLGRACWCQTHPPCGVVRDRAEGGVAHARRRRGGQPTALRPRRGAGPQGARPVDRLAGRRRQAGRRHCAVWRAPLAAARARPRSRLAAAATAGPWTGGRAPECLRRASWMASRQWGLPRSPGCWGSKAGATPQPPWPVVVQERESRAPPGPAAKTKTRGRRVDCSRRRRVARAPGRVPSGHGRRPRRGGLGRSRQRPWSLGGPPDRRSVCEPGAGRPSAMRSCGDRRRLWLVVSAPAGPPGGQRTHTEVIRSRLPRAGGRH
jgi:hypothetical protein